MSCKFKIIFILFFVVFLIGCAKVSNLATVEINGRVFEVEVADEAMERYQGLSDRDDLLEDSGMLFVFDGLTKPTFVMRRMKFDLDIVWIKNDMVVDCSQNVPVFDENGQVSLRSAKQDVNYVLELKAGSCHEYGIGGGDLVKIKLN